MPPISPMVSMPCDAQWIEAGILAQGATGSAAIVQQVIGFCEKGDGGNQVRTEPLRRRLLGFAALSANLRRVVGVDPRIGGKRSHRLGVCYTEAQRWSCQACDAAG